jgi:hypothetical protein
MIDLIFTLDYEIYGNGAGDLRELVYEPTERLKDIFIARNARFVNFVEAAEFEKIDALDTDPAIGLVKEQIRELFRTGFELGLHLHPQWCNAYREGDRWVLDASEYNLCTLPEARVSQIVQGSIAYLRHVVDQTEFTPLSFRAGNWLFQPTEVAARVLAENGMKIDSSVFKGGVQHNHGLDYRPSLGNGCCWRFGSDVNHADPTGAWVEMPIHAELKPIWKMPTAKRMNLSKAAGGPAPRTREKVNRLRDFLRFRYPMKLDFCRMTLKELTQMMTSVIRAHRSSPDSYWPVVAIGHSKDLRDFGTVNDFLSFLMENGIRICTFEEAYPKCLSSLAATTEQVDRRTLQA